MTPKERLSIRKKLRDSFRCNKFKRPEYCNYCGKKDKIEVHHYRYIPERYVWVCKKCHSNLHEGFNIDGEGNNIKTWVEKSEETKKKISESLKRYHRLKNS